MEFLNDNPIDANQIRTYMRCDPLLSKVIHATGQGWGFLHDADPELYSYKARQNELSVENGCLLWGCQVVILPNLRTKILDQLHDCQPGIVRMKSLARNYVWWPHLDSDIEQHVKHCYPCQSSPNAPAKTPLHPWEWPTVPWQRIHLDYAGPIEGRMILTVTDAHTKWIDAFVTHTATSHVTIERLCHALPLMLCHA